MKKNMYRKQRIDGSRGYSLIEMVIIIIVVGIIAAATAPLAVSSLQAYNNIESQVVVLDHMRYAMERLTREIRAIDFNASTGFAFSSMGTNSMAFSRTFYDASGAAETTTVTIGNTGSAVTLKYLNPLNTAQVLANGLNGTNGLRFLYLTSDGVTQTADPKLVRIVQVSLELTQDGSVFPQQTQVELKNFN